VSAQLCRVELASDERSAFCGLGDNAVCDDEIEALGLSKVESQSLMFLSDRKDLFDDPAGIWELLVLNVL
tara:strand:+ start:389 stop:598 length:210 start_codon:yes stop_codon:yes gene_type:complete